MPTLHAYDFFISSSELKFMGHGHGRKAAEWVSLASNISLQYDMLEN